jgi:hypothetical protein
MRVPLLALAAVLLAVPAIPVQVPADGAPAPPPAGAVPLSHGFWTPYMHIAALDIPRGIRPGAWLQIGGANCTAAFVVQDASNALYITTAGHCTTGVGQRARIKEGVLVAALGTMQEFGTVVARWPQGLDAALIRIDPDKYGNVNPRMPGWGGPTGLVTSIPALPPTVLHYGWAWDTWFEHETRCKRAVALLDDWTSTQWWVAGMVSGGGDSGSAVMTDDGRALGILDWGALVVPTPTGAFVSVVDGGTRFDAALNAFRAVGFDVSLVLGGAANPVCLPEPPVP